jgi:hypothetical protein
LKPAPFHSLNCTILHARQPGRTSSFHADLLCQSLNHLMLLYTNTIRQYVNTSIRAISSFSENRNMLSDGDIPQRITAQLRFKFSARDKNTKNAVTSCGPTSINEPTVAIPSLPSDPNPTIILNYPPVAFQIAPHIYSLLSF